MAGSMNALKEEQQKCGKVKYHGIRPTNELIGLSSLR
jgi:hypothetical protein